MILEHPTVISEGTVNPKHLIPRFLEVLEQASPNRYEPLKNEVEARLETEGEDYYDTEDASWVLDELFTELDNAFIGFTFGASEDDGACFMFTRVLDEKVEAYWYEEKQKFFESYHGYPMRYLHMGDWIPSEDASMYPHEIEDAMILEDDTED